MTRNTLVALTAAALYEVYREARGGTNGAGDPLPTSEELQNNDEHKSRLAGWLAAAEKVVYDKLGLATTSLTFADALSSASTGHDIRRTGWPEGQFVSVHQNPEGYDFPVPVLTLATGEKSPWLPAFGDILAGDWEIVGNALPVPNTGSAASDASSSPADSPKPEVADNGSNDG